MALNFQPKPGKPHIKIRVTYCICYLWPHYIGNNLGAHEVQMYRLRVNPGSYRTPGEAARALHYGSEKK